MDYKKRYKIKLKQKKSGTYIAHIFEWLETDYYYIGRYRYFHDLEIATRYKEKMEDLPLHR